MGKRIRRYVCTVCNKTLHSDINRHMRESHGQEFVKRRSISKYKCPLCADILQNYENFRDHVFTSHNLCIQMHFFKFDSQLRFITWKRKVERETKSSYVKETKICASKELWVLEEKKPCVTKKVGVIHYKCHRSGYFKMKGESERKRRFKAQGTGKINAYCPAKISAQFKRNGSVKVVYCSTHVGHECEISYLRLTEDEKRSIVAKIAANVPFDDILNEIRNSAVNGNISKMHLLSKKNLWTIYHSSYFKKYSQLLTSKTDQSNVIPSESLQDVNLHLSDEYFEDMELQTFDPTNPDSDSDMSSEYPEQASKQSLEEFNVSHRSVKENQVLRSKDVLKSSCFQKKHKEFSISQKQRKLIEKFQTAVNGLTSEKEINLVENYVNHMSDLLKSMKKNPNIFTHNVHKKQDSSKVSNRPTTLSIPNHQRPKMNKTILSSKNHTSQGVNNRLLIPVCPHCSKPKLNFHGTCAKNKPPLTFKSTCYSTQQSKSVFKVPKSVGTSETRSSTSEQSEQVKRYLVPIAGKPNKYLIVQTNPNGPPPASSLIPIPPKEKNINIKNTTIIDHNYSL